MSVKYDLIRFYIRTKQETNIYSVKHNGVTEIKSCSVVPNGVTKAVCEKQLHNGHLSKAGYINIDKLKTWVNWQKQIKTNQ